jgi:hypothetical protein
VKRLFKKAILAVGTYISPDRSVVVTPKRLKHWENQHKRLTAARQVVPAAWDHADDWEDMQPISMSAYLEQDDRPTAKNTVGRMVDFKVAPDGRRAEILYEVRGRRGIEAVENNNVFVSPVILDEWQDGAGNKYRDVITHVDLVDHPVDHSQGPFIPVKGGDGAAALSLAGREYCGLRMAVGRSKPKMFRLAIRKPAKRSTCMATIEQEDGLFHVIDDGEIFATVDSEEKAQAILKGVFDQDEASPAGEEPSEVEPALDEDDPEEAISDDADPSEPDDATDLEDDGDEFAEFFEDDETDGEPDEARMGDDGDLNVSAEPPLEEPRSDPPADVPEAPVLDASPDDARWAAQIQEDLHAAGIAAPDGVDPLTDTRAYLGQLCAALRQKRMDAAKEDQPGANDSQPENDDVTLARPEFAAMSNRLKRTEQRATAAERQLVRMGQRDLHVKLDGLLKDGKITKPEFDKYSQEIQGARMSLGDDGTLKRTRIHDFIENRESLPVGAAVPVGERLSQARPAERPMNVTGKLTPDEAKAFVDQQAARNPGVFTR